MNLNSWWTVVSFILIITSVSISLGSGWLELFWCVREFSLKLESAALCVWFLMVVGIISVCVFLWARFYMYGVYSSMFFFIVLYLFVFSMMLLTLSSSFFSVFLGWEGLGVTSFLLIIFYQNWMSMKGGLLTLLTNRVGDAVFMLSFSYWMLIGVSIEASLFVTLLSTVIFILIALTKSAQFPFISWLPAAMAAPTPVSALVHSSTLVTAGVWLLVKFGLFTYNNIEIQCYLGFTTLVVASMAALGEMDAKKLVALSTLSQLGLMFIAMSLGGSFVCFIHLMMHAMAKANLFLVVGSYLHMSYSQQDFRGMMSGKTTFSLLLFSLISLFSLSGLVMTSGFLSKDFILHSMYPIMGTMLNMLLIMCIISLTASYCLKLGLVLGGGTYYINVMWLGSSWLSFVPCLILSSFSLMMGISFSSNFYCFGLWSMSPEGLYWVFTLIVFLVLYYFSGTVNSKSLFSEQELVISEIFKKANVLSYYFSMKWNEMLMESAIFLKMSLNMSKFLGTMSVVLLSVVIFFTLLFF